MSTVTVEAKYHVLKIYINDTVHVRIAHSDDLSFILYIDAETKSYCIEFYSNGNKILTDYDNKELWLDILEKLNEAL